MATLRPALEGTMGRTDDGSQYSSRPASRCPARVSTALSAWVVLALLAPNLSLAGPAAPEPPAVVRLPTGPLPDGPPFRGAEGFDEDRYPLRSADPVALRGLLRAKRFKELTAHLEWFQEQFRHHQELPCWSGLQ